MMNYVFLVSEVGQGMAGLALQSIRVGLYSEMGSHERVQQELGELRNAGNRERVHELEGRDGMKTNHSSGFGEEACSPGDAHQRVLKVYEWTLKHNQQFPKSDESERERIRKWEN